MNKLPVTIAILAWNSSKNLSNTLESYKRNGLLDICDEVFILFQEVSKSDLELAEKYNIASIGIKENLGIGKGFATLARKAKNPNVILLEHDWLLIERKDVVYKRLKEGIQLLDEGFDVVRYRHRNKPGYPHFSFNLKGKELVYFDEWHKITSPHLLDSLHWLNPAVEFPDKISTYKGYFVTTSRYGNWTNNPCLYKRDFYLKVTEEFLGEYIDLEEKIAYWWPRQSFKVAHGEGLFSHKDVVKYSFTKRIKLKGRLLLNKFLR